PVSVCPCVTVCQPTWFRPLLRRSWRCPGFPAASWIARHSPNRHCFRPTAWTSNFPGARLKVESWRPGTLSFTPSPFLSRMTFSSISAVTLFSLHGWFPSFEKTHSTHVSRSLMCTKTRQSQPSPPNSTSHHFQEQTQERRRRSEERRVGKECRSRRKEEYEKRKASER